jgi:hypothetical protein
MALSCVCKPDIMFSSSLTVCSAAISSAVGLRFTSRRTISILGISLGGAGS